MTIPGNNGPDQTNHQHKKEKTSVAARRQFQSPRTEWEHLQHQKPTQQTGRAGPRQVGPAEAEEQSEDHRVEVAELEGEERFEDGVLIIDGLFDGMFGLCHSAGMARGRSRSRGKRPAVLLC